MNLKLSFISIRKLYLIFAVAAGTAVWGQVSDVIATRQAVMRDLDLALETLKTLAANGDSYDSNEAATLARAIRERSGKSLTHYYPAQSLSPSSAARNNIWSRWIIFAANADALGSLAVSVERKAADRGYVKKGVKAMGKICSSCHESFRTQ